MSCAIEAAEQSEGARSLNYPYDLARRTRYGSTLSAAFRTFQESRAVGYGVMDAQSSQTS
jgi:hypothetical protein